MLVICSDSAVKDMLDDFFINQVIISFDVLVMLVNVIMLYAIGMLCAEERKYEI